MDVWLNLIEGSQFECWLPGRFAMGAILGMQQAKSYFITCHHVEIAGVTRLGCADYGGVMEFYPCLYQYR